MPEINALYALGLEPSAIATYQTLVSLGRSQVGILMEKTGLSRQGIYDALMILMTKELVSYEKQGRNAWYTPEHPNKLYGLLEETKQTEALKLREAEEGIRLLTAAFNLTAHKPGVRYFEGKEGMLEVLQDSLSSPEVIYTFADIDAIVKYIEEENTQYVAERDLKKIEKRAIIADTPFARDYLKNYHRLTTDIRFIGSDIKPFGNVMQIYDNKISYITLTNQSLNAMIIQDPQIYQMHRSMFEYLWNGLEKNPPTTDSGVPDQSPHNLSTNDVTTKKDVIIKKEPDSSSDIPITSNL